MPVVIFIIFIESSNLYYINSNWHTAGQISKNITSYLDKHNDNNLLIVNIPDNLKGAYIFRNGLEIYWYKLIKRVSAIHIISAHNIDSPKDNFNLNLIKKDKEQGPIFLFSIKDILRFYNINGNEYITLNKKTSGSAFSFNLENDNIDIFFYDSGTLKKYDFADIINK
jgi:hypothetical protein